MSVVQVRRTNRAASEPADPADPALPSPVKSGSSVEHTGIGPPRAGIVVVEVVAWFVAVGVDAVGEGVPKEHAAHNTTSEAKGRTTTGYPSRTL